ncbi:MAG: hypothetical protein QG628_332 [Patescibacteria group bacterium]|nr:hypothetical protein [Patescibacteria group bacterium]
MERRDTPDSFDRIFGEDFRLISYNHDKGRMLGMEVELHRKGKIFHMTIESLPLHIERTAEMDEDEEMETTAYVLPEVEIFPSDIAVIRDAELSAIEQYLVEQE